jgi:pyruvate/2-oxoglutarate dehydrogenase complex dihydrolipoamide acyltransferase (E2) component
VNNQVPNYTRSRLPRTRRQVIDYFAEASRSHSINGLFELDVTEARRAIRRRRRETGAGLSLSSFLLHAYVRALDRHRELQAHIRNGRDLIVFDEIDVSTIIVRRVHGRSLPTTYIVRAANRKTLEEIEREIEEAQRDISASLFTSGKQKRSPAALVALLPGPVRRLILRQILRRKPGLKKRLFGTVSFSAMQMFGGGFGYGIPITPHPVHLLIGGMAKREILRNGEASMRDFVGITLTLDHDVADGAPAARFVADFRRIVETADFRTAPAAN